MGIVMGVLIIVMNFISNVWVAAPFLILLGGLGGFLVVPMNALLQHRGHNLMGAGRSIAVQNFNEQACILGLGAFYSLSTGMGMSAFGAITAFGAGGGRRHVADQRWHQSNCVKHKEEVDHLLEIARHDNRMARRAAGRCCRRSRWSSTPSSGACPGGRSASCRTRACIRLWATALVYLVSLGLLLALRPGAWRGFGGQPQLWLLMAAAGHDQRGLQLGGDGGRRGAGGAAVLPDAGVDACCWPGRCWARSPRPSALLRLALALAGVAIVLKTAGSPWPVPESAGGLAGAGGRLQLRLDQHPAAQAAPRAGRRRACWRCSAAAP